MSQRVIASTAGQTVVSANLLQIVNATHGHFAMESGYHSEVWLDLDSLFADMSRIEPFVAALAHSLSRYNVDVVCGPLVGGAFLAQSLAMRLNVEFWYTERVNDRDAEKLFAAQYRLPAAFRAGSAHPRVAIVDDVMSAGSSLRATYAALQPVGAKIVAVGALLVMGSIGLDYFQQIEIPVEAVAYDKFETWHPDSCPHCLAGLPVDAVAKK